jgi:hypothetical protein
MLNGQSPAGVAGRRFWVLRAAVEEPMVMYGLFLFVLANLLKMSFLSWLGFIFVIIGGGFSLSGYFGHPVGGRRNWY